MVLKEIFDMECKYTCFDRVIHLIKKLSDDKLYEAMKIIRDSNFEDFLDFCEENGCFTKEQASTILDFVIMWEDLESNYCEEDKEKLIKLYEAVGITKEIFEKYIK